MAASRAGAIRRRVGAFGLALACLGVAHAGFAAPPKLQAVGETSVGVSDNATSAPDVPLPGGATKTAGAFVVLRPSLVLGLLSARTVQRLSYTFDYDLYFAGTQTSSSSNRLEYRGFYDLARGLNAVVGATASESDSYGALTFAPPASGALPFLPNGTSRIFQGSIDESVNDDFAVGWRAWEGGGFVFGTPLFGTSAPETLSPNARIGTEYAWLGNAVGAEARADYTVIHDGILANGTRVRLQRELVTRAAGLYRHDLGRYFTSRLEAGAARLDRLETHQSLVYPTGSATLSYADVIGNADLTYTHALTTNVLLGQSFLSDQVRLYGVVPLDQKATFSLAASSSYQRGRLIDENAHMTSHVSLLLADVTFGWQAKPWLLLGVRAQHLDQRSDTRVITLPVSFVQNNVMLGASLKFPPDPEMPAAYRSPQRVDRADELRAATVPDGQAVAAPTSRGH